VEVAEEVDGPHPRMQEEGEGEAAGEDYCWRRSNWCLRFKPGLLQMVEGEEREEALKSVGMMATMVPNPQELLLRAAAA
jgi:hypothetical protein